MTIQGADREVTAISAWDIPITVWEAIKDKAAREERSANYVVRRALEREAARKR